MAKKRSLAHDLPDSSLHAGSRTVRHKQRPSCAPVSCGYAFARFASPGSLLAGSDTGWTLWAIVDFWWARSISKQSSYLAYGLLTARLSNAVKGINVIIILFINNWGRGLLRSVTLFFNHAQPFTCNEIIRNYKMLFYFALIIVHLHKEPKLAFHGCHRICFYLEHSPFVWQVYPWGQQCFPSLQQIAFFTGQQP